MTGSGASVPKISRRTGSLIACCMFSLSGLLKLESRVRVDCINYMGTGMCCATRVRHLVHSRKVHFAFGSLHRALPHQQP